MCRTSEQFVVAVCGPIVQVNLSVATETTAELERLLQDISAPPADSNKYVLHFAKFELFVCQS